MAFKRFMLLLLAAVVLVVLMGWLLRISGFRPTPVVQPVPTAFFVEEDAAEPGQHIDDHTE